MNILVTGGSGQLGYDIKQELLKRGYAIENVLCPNHHELDITNEDMVRNFILANKPGVVFHCAAYTAVDKAEDEKEKCYEVNVNGTRYITKYADMIGAKVIYISTDYVFDGAKDGAYQVDDKINPINYYGKTKYYGEEEVKKCSNYAIVRISWVFGINGKNFIKTMLRLSQTKNEINVVSDQIGSPTYTEDAAIAIVDLGLGNYVGTYHVTNEGYCSWYDFAKYIFEVNRVNIKINPILTKDYPTVAVRPHNSKLDKSCLDEIGFARLPQWQDAVERYSRVLKKGE